MIKKQIEKMKSRSAENPPIIYETISLKMPSKNYAMFDLLSQLNSEPKISFLSKEISIIISEIISSESEIIDMIEEIMNSIPKSQHQKSFIEELVNQGVASYTLDENKK